LHDRGRDAPARLKSLKPLAIEPLGDAAVYAQFSESLDLEVNEALQAVAAELRWRAPPWMHDVIPALTGIALLFDPDHREFPAAPIAVAEALLRDCIKAAPAHASPRALEVPVCYDPEFALDIVEVAERTGVAPEEIARRHSGVGHRVLMVGFSPGLPYVGGLDPALAVPRRATPRIRVPAGSVAIANLQTTVYPFETPGGWSVIGRTPLVLFDPAREPPTLFAPGDHVRFVSISRSEYARLR
jgi:inhibitor of KinA